MSEGAAVWVVADEALAGVVAGCRVIEFRGELVRECLRASWAPAELAVYLGACAEGEPLELLEGAIGGDVPFSWRVLDEQRGGVHTVGAFVRSLLSREKRESPLSLLDQLPPVVADVARHAAPEGARDDHHHHEGHDDP